MRTVSIPDTELKVSSICLGSTDIGSKIDRKTSFRILDLFVDLGGTFIDTASVYANWRPGPTSVSEKTIGDWCAQSGKRDRVVIATKGGHPDLNTMHVSRLSREEIVHDLDASLQNLRTEVIDFYWLHRDNPARPAGEIIEVLAELAKAGKIRCYGCSNWRAERIAEAQAYAAEKQLPGFRADQMMWSLAVVERKAMPDQTTVAMDDDLHGYHVETRLPAVPYSSQAGGLFQKMSAGTVDRMPAHQWTMYGSGENRARYVRARELAKRLSTTLTCIVLGYIQSQPFVTAPIVGCQSPEQLQDSALAGDVRLSAEEVAFLEGRAELS